MVRIAMMNLMMHDIRVRIFLTEKQFFTRLDKAVAYSIIFQKLAILGIYFQLFTYYLASPYITSAICGDICN
ncbi:MAG: hypothetical protein PWQ51_2639 [Methanolobus sp.]|jgi:hypothetical protein|nr:hypothetical protein [Methanolobus sp.]